MITEIKHIILNLTLNIVTVEFVNNSKTVDPKNISNIFIISANGFLYGSGNKFLTKQLIVTN